MCCVCVGGICAWRELDRTQSFYAILFFFHGEEKKGTHIISHPFLLAHFPSTASFEVFSCQYSSHTPFLVIVEKKNKLGSID